MRARWRPIFFFSINEAASQPVRAEGTSRPLREIAQLNLFNAVGAQCSSTLFLYKMDQKGNGDQHVFYLTVQKSSSVMEAEDGSRRHFLCGASGIKEMWYLEPPRQHPVKGHMS